MHQSKGDQHHFNSKSKNGKREYAQKDDRTKELKSKKINKNFMPSSSPKPNLEQLPTIEQLLAIQKQQRLQKSTIIFEKVKPFLRSFMQKKQGSRVTQLLFKWGNQSTRQFIWKQITKNWKQLIKSKYALFIIAKVSKDFELPGLVQDMDLLQNNREGAQILQNYISSNPESQLVKKLKSKILQYQEKASKQNDIKAQQLLDNLASRSIQKQYYWFQLSKLILRLRLATMFDQQKQKAIQLLSENVASIVTNQEGVKLFIELMNNCSTKEKKSILKQYKGHVDQIVKAGNLSYVSLMKLMIETDDTVLIMKSLQEQLIQLISEILNCKKAFDILFFLFCPRNNNFNVLGKFEPHVVKTLCKKPENQRKKQLREYLYQPIFDFLKIQDNLSKIIQQPIKIRLIIGLEKSMRQGFYSNNNSDHHSLYQSFVTFVLQYFFKNTKQSLQANTFSSNVLLTSHGTKVLKSLLCIHEDFIEFYCEEFAKIFIKYIKVISQSSASFVLLGILQKGGRDHLIRQIVKTGVKFDKCVAGQHFIKLIENLSVQPKQKDFKRK